jgi:aminoglycoside phosphotransferase (APT) family kinase protein
MVISSDLTPDHIRLAPDGVAVFIDWEQARYGPLFIDLVNFFDAESVGVYRTALAAEGVEIDEREFMELFSRVGHWMGLRYLEVGLLAWQLPADDPEWMDVRTGLRQFFDLCLNLALHGR